MKTLHFNVPNDLSFLHDQLLTAIPDLQPIANAQGERTPVLRVEGTDTEIWLTVPDNSDENAIAAVVTAHDATTKPVSQREAELARIVEILEIARSDWTAAQFRELLQLIAQDLTRRIVS